MSSYSATYFHFYALILIPYTWILVLFYPLLQLYCSLFFLWHISTSVLSGMSFKIVTDVGIPHSIHLFSHIQAVSLGMGQTHCWHGLRMVLYLFTHSLDLGQSHHIRHVWPLDLWSEFPNISTSLDFQWMWPRMVAHQVVGHGQFYLVYDFVLADSTLILFKQLTLFFKCYHWNISAAAPSAFVIMWITLSDITIYILPEYLCI